MLNKANSQDVNDQPVSRDELLHRWLSVAESQICSLEVLCGQLPKMNELLEENMIALGDSFAQLAAQAQAQAKNVENIVCVSQSLLVDGKAASLIDELEEIKIICGDAEVIKRLDGLIAASHRQQEDFAGAAKIAEISSLDMVSSVSRGIVGMQFQDRVSQNLVIADNVVKENVRYLKENIDKSLERYKSDDEFGDGHGRAQLDIDFAKRLVSLLTLGELQHQFVDHLIAHNYIDDGSLIGFTEESVGASEDVELF